MSKVYYNGNLLAIKVSRFKDGSLPQTDGSEYLQLLTLKYPKKHFIKPHYHKPAVRKTKHLQECLVVIKGKIRVDVYSEDKKLIKRIFLKAGEAILLLGGGHAVNFIKDAKLIEIKNGPFLDDKIFL